MTPRTMTPPDEIRSMIARVRRRWMMQVRLRAAGLAMTAAAMPLVLALLIVYAARPAGLPFLVLMVAAVVLAIVGGAVPIVRMRKRPADRQVARYIEERLTALTGDESLNDGLVSALDVADSSETHKSSFGDLVVERGSRQLGATGPADIIPPKTLRAGAWTAAAGAAFFLAALTTSAPALIRAGDVARVTFFPGAIQVEVLPGNVRLAAGTPLRVRTIVRGGEKSLSQVSPVLTMSARGERQSIVMTPVGEAFEYAIPGIDRTFSYSVRAGSARSADYTVTALFPPRVTRIDLSYVYPSFSGLAPREEQDGGDIYAPAGSRVRLRIHADKPVTRGELTFGRGPAVAVRAVAEGVVEADVLLAADDSYRVQLADRDGLQSRGESEYFIRLMNDRPPDVRILRPSSDQQITPLEEIAVEARADDDYGIARFDLVYAVGGGAERTLSFERVTGTPVERVGTTLLSAEELGVKPGDVISYYARARDVGRGKRSMQATSDIFFLEVKPFSEEFVSAQSQASGQGGAQIDGLVEAQKQIIASTWNIERRSTGGRSAEDIKSVAEAQAALKARAQQVSSRGSRRFGSMPQRVAQAPQPAPLSDPIAAAILAMDKAVEQLQTDRTKDALPHEMAALNGLLQAQAEVRRREVARQQANGSGNSGNRVGQDMSALFDKELQRQQQTNYETKPSVESRADRAESEDSMLDRIRDLARRQEDLSRRQRELGQSSPDADELRRQLETLTREQTKLREEAEELARRLASQGGQSSAQNGGRSQGGTTSGRSSGERSDKTGGQSLRDAVEQMRAAANDLTRKDAGTAAQSGTRAAEQLRRFEAQTRAGASGPGDRARSDLQLEGQQIAQEQRRIAAEAERLDRGTGGAATDARKRLADEKGRLAQRVDELQRAIARSGAGAKGSSSNVARELGAVGQRMRESAQQMRDAPQGQSASAKGEQELARSLERIAGQLNAGVSPEAQQLSAELDEMHAIRDRLQRLEQQMRDAAPEDGPSPEPGQRSSGRGGQQGDGGGGGRGGAGQTNEGQRLQEEYRRELERSRQALERLSGGQPTGGQNGGTPTSEQFSRSAPGTEAFKQDRSGWESLRKALDLALDQHEAAVSGRLTRKAAEDRFSAGGSERVPDGYQPLIARYFESLASAKKVKNP